MSDPKPNLNITYRRADGQPIDDYGWVTDLDCFDDDDYPVQLVKEQWTRSAVEVFWHLPTTLYDCGVPTCDEDAVGWVQDDEKRWRQTCAEHADGLDVVIDDYHSEGVSRKDNKVTCPRCGDYAVPSKDGPHKGVFCEDCALAESHGLTS